MRGQGLPLNTIVLGALALLVLVLLAAAFVPSIGNMFRQMFGIAGTAQEQFIRQCQIACQNLNQYDSTTLSEIIASSDFCTITNSTGTHCYEIMSCTIHTTDGQTKKISKGTSCTLS